MALLALCVSLSGLLAQSPAPRTALAPKVVVIGLDGVSLNILEPFIAEGVAPNLGRLLQEGARGDLASYWPLRTPQVWTSVVTGKLPGQHGLWDHVSNSYYNPPPFRTTSKTFLTTAERKSKALWQILSEKGLRTLSVGWISSWPAEAFPGATIVAPAQLHNDKRSTSIKGSFWRSAEGQVAPAELWSTVRDVIVEPQDVDEATLARFADLPPPKSPIYELPFLSRYVYTLRWSLARATSVEKITLALAERRPSDVAMAYFQCSDSLLHRFWIFQESEAAIRERLDQHGIPSAHAAELKKRFGNVVRACYRDLDERVGRLLTALRGPDTLVLVVSDHGFGEAPVPHPSKQEPYGGNHRDDGIIIAAGPGIAAGSRVQGASVLDVTPTILHVLGLPVADDMRGRALISLFASGPLGKKPMQKIPTYEAKPQTEVPFAEGWPPRKERPLAIDN